MLAAAEGIHALLQSSAELYSELIDGQQLDCQWQRVGLMNVHLSEHEFDEFSKANDLTRERFGVAARPIPGNELSVIEPALKDGLGGAWFYDCDSHLRPDRLMAEMKRRLVEVGVEIHEDVKCQDLVKRAGRVSAVRTSMGEFPAQNFVFATGALTPFLNSSLGANIPIQPGKGYSITMPRPAICPRYPMIFEQHRVAITPLPSAYRIGSTMEFAGYDASINQRRVAALRRSAEFYLREPYAEPVLETWFGWRPMTWDSLPFIDQAPIADNVWLAAGHNMLGLSTATATGKLLAEMINQTSTHLDPEPYQIARIRAHKKRA